MIDRNTPEYAAIVAILDDGEMAMQRPDSQETADLIVAALAAPSAPDHRLITGQVLHRAWLKSGRRDPLLDGDAWDGFALTVQAVLAIEQRTEESDD